MHFFVERKPFQHKTECKKLKIKSKFEKENFQKIDEKKVLYHINTFLEFRMYRYIILDLIDFTIKSRHRSLIQSQTFSMSTFKKAVKGRNFKNNSLFRLFPKHHTLTSNEQIDTGVL